MIYHTVEAVQCEPIIDDTDDIAYARQHALFYSALAETTVYIYTDDEPHPTEKYVKGEQRSAVTVYPTFGSADVVLVHVEYRTKRVLIAYISEHVNQFGRPVAVVSYRATYREPSRSYCRISDALAAIRRWAEIYVAQGEEL